MAFGTAEALLESDDLSGATCLILDVQLPGINGFALHRQLAARGPLPPVIFITAFDRVDTQAQAMEAGASAFLSKPLAGRVLLATIHRVLEGESPGEKLDG